MTAADSFERTPTEYLAEWFKNRDGYEINPRGNPEGPHTVIVENRDGEEVLEAPSNCTEIKDIFDYIVEVKEQEAVEPAKMVGDELSREYSIEVAIWRDYDRPDGREEWNI